MKTYIIRADGVYLYTTPNGKWSRFTSEKRAAMRMCETCTAENMKWMESMDMHPEKEEAGKLYAIMPTCREHLK